MRFSFPTPSIYWYKVVIACEIQKVSEAYVILDIGLYVHDTYRQYRDPCCLRVLTSQIHLKGSLNSPVVVISLC